MNKSHLFFRNPEEGLEIYRPRTGGSDGRKEKEEKDYTYMAEVFFESLAAFANNIEARHNNRNLTVPVHFDLIEIEFFGAFDQPQFEGYYSNTFGLSLMHLSSFNRKGLFAIENEDKFYHFQNQIKLFIKRILEETQDNYDGKVKYIKNFKLFSSNDMLGNIDNYNNIHLSFMGKGFIEENIIKPQKEAFKEYLNDKHIEYFITESEAELIDISEDIIKEILNNFDFIYASCSSSGAIIKPDRYNAPTREFGFEIINSNSELPIIGIIDTGISNGTPLRSILIGNESDYDATGTSSFIDNADHGTGVAAFAAFGNKLIPGYRGQVEADAKLLPIKILDSNEGAISQQKTIELIRKANEEYQVRIFTLTIGYTKFPLRDNTEFSSYARMLDELTSELDILIFISTTNNIFNITNPTDYPSKFIEEQANIAPPAESMNNITVGAVADNFINNNLNILATYKEFPAIYSRKLHYNFDDTDLFNTQTANHYIRKPDILFAGGDYTEYMFMGDTGYDYGGEAGLEVLSSNLEHRTYYKIGTSFSAPLTANLAARLLKIYPDLDMQSIKALLINGAKPIVTGETFNGFSNNLQKRIMGYGIPEINSTMYSDDNKVTMIIEDEIYPDYIKMFPIQIPEYLNTANKLYSLLVINATLCFKFFPKPDNQLLYCPYHISFAIGKNMALNRFHIENRTSENGRIREADVPDGYNGNSSKNIKLNSSSNGWSQDYFYKGKVVSNVQKVMLKIKKANIIDEQNCFKIAINAAFQKMLTEAEKEIYNGSIPYSLVINIEQFPVQNEVLPSLYNELTLINNLDAVAEADIELEV